MKHMAITGLEYYRRQARKRRVLAARQAKDWSDYLLENSPALIRRIEKSRRELRTGKGIRLEDIEK